MDLSRLRTRRNLLALALAGIAARVVPVRAAQTTAGCDIGWVNGLLTVGGENCNLVGGPGMQGANISLPGHMVDATDTGITSGATSSQESSTLTASSSGTTTSPKAERQAKLRARRAKRRRQRGRKTDKKKDKKTRRRTRKQERRAAEEEAARKAALKRCEHFSDQKSAIEYLAQYEDAEEFLDPDRDGMACEHLEPVTCGQFTTQPEAASWWKRHGFTASRDPYGLYDTEEKKVCPELPTPTTDG